MTHRAILVAICWLAFAAAPSAQRDPIRIGQRLLQDERVQAAVAAIRRREPETIADQIRLCEVPAPPFEEKARGETFASELTRLGLANVRVDKAGNVLGERRGTGRGPHLVFSAHLDTVFPAGTPVTVTRQGSVLKGPGIGDDCRGLAVVLGVIRALDEAKIQTPGPITFVGTVGEEGLGDLRGVKHLFAEELKGRIDRFVSVDGTGLGFSHIAVGSLRYRITFKGPGGHSYGSFGQSNPIHALGRAVARISEITVPPDPRTTFSVGRIGGGTSVNAIPADAWFEIDLRSSDAVQLKRIDTLFHTALDEALAAEHARWGNKSLLTIERELVGDRPGGQTPLDAPIVRATVSVTEALGFRASTGEGSTDSNVAINLNVPAVTIAGGGRGTGAHSLDETFDTADSWQGSQRALLLAIALVQP